MKRKLTGTLTAALLLGVGLVVLKLTVLLSYAEAELRPAAIAFITQLQASGEIDPKDCAARYLYFNTDYHRETPSRIRITLNELSEDRVRVTLQDPSCRDDSVHSSIDRVFLHRSDAGIWVPYRHDWSHTGRGTFGWTTAPTN